MNDRELFDFLIREPAAEPCAAPDPVHVHYGDTALILCRSCHWQLYEPYSGPSGLQHNVPYPPLAALDLLEGGEE